jgi:hypothetical protein
MSYSCRLFRKLTMEMPTRSLVQGFPQLSRASLGSDFRQRRYLSENTSVILISRPFCSWRLREATSSNAKRRTTEDSVPKATFACFLTARHAHFEDQLPTPEFAGVTAEFSCVFCRALPSEARKKVTNVGTSTVTKSGSAIAFVEPVMDIGHLFSHLLAHAGFFGRKLNACEKDSFSYVPNEDSLLSCASHTCLLD